MWNKLFSLFFGNKGKTENSHKTILVIDDGEVERKFISRSLEKGGYKVATAEEGETGIKIAQEIRPDLILLDFIMPGIRGDVVCKRLKMDDRTKDIPVIFLTGSVKPMSVIDSYESGAEYYLSKPISTKELLKEVDTVFKEKATPAISP